MNKRTEQTRWTPKRLLSLLMALIMTLSLLPTAAFAADGEASTLGTSAENPVEITFSSDRYATADTSLIKKTITEEDDTSYTVTFKPQIQFVDNSGKGTASTFIYQSGIPFKPGVSISTNANEEKTIGRYTYTVQQVNADGTDAPNTTTVTNNILGTSTIRAASSLSCEGSDFTAKALENNMIRLKYTVYEGESASGSPFGEVYVGITGITVTDIKYNVSYKTDGPDDNIVPVSPEGNNSYASYTVSDAIQTAKAGYTFTGWKVHGPCKQNGAKVNAGEQLTNITGDITLTADYEQNYTITFQSEYSGASGLMTPATSNGTKYTVPVEPTMYGFTFAGWKATYTNSGAELTPKSSFAPSEQITGITQDITLTAQWTKDGTTPVGSHSVKFVRNNATDGSALNWPDNLTGAKDSTVTIPWLIPQAEGYTFLGWSTTENATTANYHPNDTVTITDTDISLYAVWQAKNYTITYTPNDSLTGVTLINTASSITPGTLASFNVKVDAKYDASSMIVAANGVPLGYSTKTENNDGSTTYTYSFVPTGDTAVTVSQPEQKSYVVTLPVGDHFTAKFDGTDTKSDKTVTYNGSVSFTVTADSGWTIEDVSYTGDATLTQDATDSTKYTLTDIKSNVAVSVKMKQIPVYTISYSIDEAYFTSQKVTGESANVTLITPAERTGYNFDGWYKNPDYTDKAEATLTVTGDVNLYGRYMPKTYSIKYDLNAPTGATVTPNTIDATTKTYGQAVTLSAVTPTCDGYDFLGWAKGENKGLVVYAAGATVSEELTDNMTLYAVWAKKTYTITLQGGSGYTVSSNRALVVEHGSDFTFTVTVDGAYAATEPMVTISSTANGTLTKTDGNFNSEHKAATYTYKIENVTADQVVTVKVTENARATVTFQYRVVDAQGNELIVDGLNGQTFMTQAVQLGDPAAQPQQPNIEGYRFVRWCGADHPTATTHEAYDFTKPVAGELTIYAEITPILPVITVDALNGTGWKTENWKHGAEGTETPAAISNNAFTIAYGDNVTFDLVIAKGYDYSKLSVTANGLALGYQSATTNTDGSTTLHYYLGSVMADTRIAITGIERKTVTVIYNANARDDVSGLPTAEKVKYYLEALGETGNDKITTQVPSRTGYEFVGWCTDSEATVTVNGNTKTINTETGVVVYPGSTAKFTTDTTLYAIWLAQDTELTLKITDVAYDTQQNNRVIQYEGESITLQATLNVNAKGTVVFYKGDKEGTNGTRIGSAAINGKTAELSVKVGDYKAGGVTEHYWAVFVSETDEGYANSEKSNIMNVGVFSKAITWPLDTKNADTLTITEATGSMTAGKTYKLTVDITKILGLETVTPDNAPKLGEDYAIVWQYKNTVTGDWADMSAEITDTNEYQVTPEYAGHEYRAKIVPIGDLYTKAAKFDENGIVNNEYDKFLYTNTVGSVLQSTATALTIDAPEESKDIKINGDTPFTAIGEHKAQFEGQAVTLTAKVTKDGGTGVETGKVEFYRLDGTEWKLIDTVNVETQGTNTGVASTTYTMGTYDSTSASASATTNKETFKAVYVANETYATSTTDGNAAVYIKSAKLMTPIIESTLAGTLNGTVANSTSYEHDLIGLLAGVQHTFKLRQDADQTAKDYSVVAKDGRTVAAENYDIEWQYKTTGNFAKADNDSTAVTYTTKTTEVGDQYRVVLNAKGDMTVGATSKVAEIGTKQDVTVTVKALDAITKTPETDVYQLNEITLTATVAAANDKPTMQPTGTVTFYYLEEGATNKWIELGTSTLTKNAQSTQGEMIATIQTTKLPVAKTTYTSLPSKITAVYSGDDTFQQNQTFTKDTASTKDLVFGTIANVNGNTTNDVEVTVRSSVVKGCADANKAVTTLSDTGIHISADGLAAHEGLVTLKLDEVYTLDAKKAYSKLLAGTDYTVQWQILSGASAHNNGGDYSSADAWVNIDGATGTTYTLTTVEQDAAYRAVITVANEPITKGSFTEIEQDANALLNGHKQYYSNVLCAADGQTTIDVLIDTNGRGTNKEGITEGETVNVNVFLSGATQATPIADVTVKIENDTAKGNNETYSTTLTGSTVNGWNVFPWNTVGVAPGFYKVTVSSKSNTGYADETVTRSLIVRESSYTIAPSNTTVTYNGRTQGLTVALNGFGFNGTGINEAANKSWTVKYYDKDNNLVEPTQAGTYRAVITLPASAYWTEQTKTVDFTIEKRSVSIADAIAQAKVYDGTTDVNIVEVMLNDAETEQGTTGWLKSGENTGIINGDSIYAVATAAVLEKANAGENKFTISAIDLLGDDANNYVWDKASYTENIYVSRSQVYGVSSTDVTLKAGEKLPADAVYMIDQAGNKITSYDVLYYLHTDTEIKKVDNTNEKGLYTVIVRPKQDNYKSGVTLRVTVGDATGYTSAVAPKPSTLIYLSDTATKYNSAGNVPVTAKNAQGNTVKVEYHGTTWSETVPSYAGRYLVKATDTSTGDVAYGIYTITKAHPSIGITAAEATYNSMPYTGATPDLTKATENPEHYLTYAGDVAIGYNTPADGNVDEQAPVDAGTYTVTLHVNETENYTAHEISKSFTIEKKPLTIEAKKVGTWQYGSMPGFYASYEGLAGDVNDSTPDTSLRDVQIAPELLFNPTSNNQSNYSNDALDQVGKIIIRPVDALSKNYELTPVDGEFTKNEEDPQPTLSILGLPQNGKSADVTVYYGDEIQLSAYGNYLARRNTSSFLKWEITNSTLTNGSVSIDENNILHVNGVGTFTVKLTRGTARQAITTEITVTAIQKEAKIALKNVDKVYNGASQTYAYEGNVTVHDELYQPIGNFVDSKLMRTNTARTDVGTQITTAKVTGAWAYQSETYGGKFTINDKDATVAPVAQSTVYGTLEAFDATKCTVTGKAGSVDPVTGVNVASQTDAYNRLDVHDGYEILVAGTENMNYNVKYTTDHNDTAKNADDSAVTTYGGMKLYSTTTKAKNELNDATVYGEQANDLDWILDAVKSTTRDSVDYADNLADFDLTDTTGIFIKQDKDDCVGNAKTYKAANREEGNTSSTALAADRTATDTAKDDNYELKFGSVTNAKAANYTLANAEVKNAEGTMTAPTGTVGFIGAAATSDNLIEGSANIAQRPIKLEQAVTDAQLYWRLPQSQLYTALVNILKAEENSVGRGLAKGHTIEDLDLSFTIKVGSTTYNVAKDGTDAINFAATGNATVTATVGDTNYKLEGGQYQFDIVLKNIQIEATYTTKTFTGFTVLIKVHNENGTITPLNDAKGLSYKIFKKTGNTIDKTTAYASGTLTYQNRTAYDDKGGLCGVFTATYPQLPLLNSGETYFIQMYEYGVELKTNS